MINGFQREKKTVRVLAIGDVVGQPGRTCVEELLPRIKRELNPCFIIANGENAAHGFGLTRKTADDLLAAGVHVLTGGNHTFDNADIYNFIAKDERILRPANYPPDTPGRGWTVQTIGATGLQIAVINLMGRAFMVVHTDCPIRTLEGVLAEIPKDIRIRVLDYHAEATSEKYVLCRYFDGELSFIFGTHTHVQTADEQLLPKGTAYISDLGMTGAMDSVLGMRSDLVSERMITSRPVRLEPATEGLALHGVIADIDPDSGLTTAIKRVRYELL